MGGLPKISVKREYIVISPLSPPVSSCHHLSSFGRPPLPHVKTSFMNSPFDYGEYQLLWLISSSTNLTMMRMIARHARRLKLLIGLCLCESPTTIGGTSELWRCSQLLFSIINSKLKIVFFFKPLLAAWSIADLPRNYMMQCKIEFTYASRCVNKNLRPRRMLKKCLLIAKINWWSNSFQNMYDML